MSTNLYNLTLGLGGSEAGEGAWNAHRDVDENLFPWGGAPEAQAKFLLRYAILSPSTYNTQPWKFALVPGGIEVYADYTRRMPVADPGNRELVMSVGAAIFTLRVAAERFSLDCRVSYTHSGDSERPMAVVALAPRSPHARADEALASLFVCIPRRHTNRRPFLFSRVPESILRSIRGLHSGGLASAVVSTDGSVNALVSDLVAAADRTRMADPSFRSNIAEWVRPNWTQKGDGVTGAALGMNPVASAIGSWTTRVVDGGAARAARDRNLCAEAPGLVVLESEDSVPHWLACGELLQHILLVLTREGLHHSYFNMPVQVPDVRLRLRAACGLSSWPQILLRIGFSLVEPASTPRRSLDEMLLTGKDRIDG